MCYLAIGKIGQHQQHFSSIIVIMLISVSLGGVLLAALNFHPGNQHMWPHTQRADLSSVGDTRSTLDDRS